MTRKKCFSTIPEEVWISLEADSRDSRMWYLGGRTHNPTEAERETYVEECAIDCLSTQGLSVCAQCGGSGLNPADRTTGQKLSDCSACLGAGTVACPLTR